VVTATGTTNTLNGEANLIFNGSSLRSAKEVVAGIHGGDDSEGRILATGGTAEISFMDRAETSFSSTAGKRWLWYSTGNVARFWSNGDLLGITPSGSVGIGTTSPSERLTVSNNIRLGTSVGSTSTPSYLDTGTNFSDGTTRNKCKIYLYNTGTEQYGFSVGSTADIQYHSNGIHDFYIANGHAVRINSSANVGIGTTGPVAKLNVHIGDIAITATPGANTRDSRYLSIYRGSLGADSCGVIFGTGPSTNNWFIGQPYSGGGVFNALIISERELINDGNGSLVKTPLMYFTPGTGTAAGGVGIGTTSPGNFKLYVNGTSYFTGVLRVDTDSYLLGSGYGIYGNNDAANYSIRGSGGGGGALVYNWYGGHLFQTLGGSTRLTIDSSGNVGINQTSPSARLHVTHVGGNGAGGTGYSEYGIITNTSSGQATLGAMFDGDGYANLNLGSVESGTRYFWHISKRVASNGRRLEFYFHDASGFDSKGHLDTSGNFVVKGDVTAYGSPSDITYKTDINTVQHALNTITKLRGVTFKWKEDSETYKTTNISDDIGFIAQEVQEVLPTVVRQNENGKLSIRDKAIIPLLVEAIKELKAEIEVLKHNTTHKE
jgi:hypothetical protein